MPRIAFSTMIFMTVLFLGCAEEKRKEKEVSDVSDINEKIEIKSAFDSYKNALQAGKAKEAASYIDQPTVKYYANILELTKYGVKEKIDSLNIVDRLLVYVLRQKLDSVRVINMSGRELFAFSVEQDLTSKSSISDLTLGEIDIEKDSAAAVVLSKGQPTGNNFIFHREDGDWKLNLASVLPSLNKMIVSMLEKQKMSEEEFVKQMLNSILADEEPKDIFSPMFSSKQQ